MDILKNNRTTILVEGILFAILGFSAILLPVASTLALEIIVGWLLLIGGLVQGYRTLQSRHANGFWISLASSILYIVLGIGFLLYPVAGVISLTIALMIFFLLEGIAKIILGFQIKPQTNWGWLVVSGIISILMAIIIWSGWPGTAFWVLGLLLGINMLFFGTTLIMLGLAIPKKDEPSKEPKNQNKI